MITLLKSGMVWDTDHFRQTDIAIADQKIEFVDKAPEDFACDALYDVSGKYIVPGVIDCHAHITMSGGNRHMAEFFAADENHLAVEGVVNARKMVTHGITSARDCGGKFMETLAVRDAINSGKIVGPRLLCSGTPIKIVGGHEPGYDVTGVDEARRAARLFIYKGVDFLKVMITGGLGKAGEDPGAVEFELDEVREIVREAKKKGKKVACHCHSRKGMELLLDAGADSIEHATYLDREVNERIMAQGVYVVPTFFPYEIAAAEGEERGLLMDTVLAARAIVGEKRRRLKQAYEQGVAIAFGRDSGGFFMDQGEFANEMALMENAGMQKKDIIRSASENAANLLGIWHETGSLDAGKAADVLVLDRDPLVTWDAYREGLRMVYANGQLVTNR